MAATSIPGASPVLSEGCQGPSAPLLVQPGGVCASGALWRTGTGWWQPGGLG